MSTFWTEEKVASHLRALKHAEAVIMKTDRGVIVEKLVSMEENERNHQLVYKLAELEDMKHPIPGLPNELQAANSELVNLHQNHCLNIINQFNLIWTPRLRDVYKSYLRHHDREVQHLVRSVLAQYDENVPDHGSDDVSGSENQREVNEDDSDSADDGDSRSSDSEEQDEDVHDSEDDSDDDDMEVDIRDGDQTDHVTTESSHADSQYGDDTPSPKRTKTTQTLNS